MKLSEQKSQLEMKSIYIAKTVIEDVPDDDVEAIFRSLQMMLN